MAWLEAHQSLSNHPKLRKLARLLGVSRPTAAGHVLFFWFWCLDYAQDGDVTGFDWCDIAEAAMWQGDCETFRRSLSECGSADGPGFTEIMPDGRTLVHDWYEYAGKLIERREKDAERKRSVRRTSDGHLTDGVRTNQTNHTNLTNQQPRARADGPSGGANGPAAPRLPAEVPYGPSQAVEGIPWEQQEGLIRQGFTREEIALAKHEHDSRPMADPVTRWDRYLPRIINDLRKRAAAPSGGANGTTARARDQADAMTRATQRATEALIAEGRIRRDA